MNATSETVAARIRRARYEKGLSQEGLASAIGSTRQMVIRWEGGKHKPNTESRRRLGEALGHEPAFFADDDEEPLLPGGLEILSDLLRIEIRRIIAEESTAYAA